MEKIVRSSSLILLFGLLFLNFHGFVQIAEAGKRRIEISDDLDDVEDNEEDDSWKEWGKKATTPEFDPPPDFTNMGFDQIQEEMAKRSFGTVVGFVKLRLGVRRTKDMVIDIAMKWTKVLRTGGIEVRFMAVDRSTVMFNMQNGKLVTELREFVLSQEEAYEVKIGKQEFRRPGDPPFEDVFDKLQAEQRKDHEDGDSNKNDLTKDEL
ncbi:LRP chaperone MESD [Arabidopsis thaliana x Arabidopsis arenosa]|uniref:LRP chaperone MESD n=1 Tax=Arabidopsis thaliana x Arabidopsis arenosa TaxID=1240361 RepID=A0A8T2AAL5_9BRAS|nr:LRP chaperone MESD [Arabidopsis thaliana x Arabidopsis arenosa]